MLIRSSIRSFICYQIGNGVDINDWEDNWFGHRPFNPRGISDHAIGILVIKSEKRKKPRGFKFDNFMAEHLEFLHVVLKEWNRPVF